MDKAKLKILGKRLIVTGVALLPVHAAIIIAFAVLARDPLATFALAMPLLALSVCLIGFGAAALSSAK